MRQFVVLSFFTLSSLMAAAAEPSYIKVVSQKDFDQLDAKIETAFKSGSNEIIVTLNPGTYTYSESHLRMKYADSALHLTIVGNGSVLRGKSQSFEGKTLNPEFVYYNEGEIQDFWSKVVQTDKLAEVVEKDKKVCRIQRVAKIEVSEGDYIQESQWYLTKRYAVCKVSDDWIYFVAPDLEYSDSYKGWNINMDYLYGKEMPRYRIFKSGAQCGQESNVANFLALDNIRIGSLLIQGITFEGCAYSNWKGLVRINGVEAERLRIINCKFLNSKSVCININDTKNVEVAKCSFENNHGPCIKDDQMCRNIAILNNSFVNNSHAWINRMNVSCSSEDFIVSGNAFKDFGYGAISIGVWYGSKKIAGHKVSGIVENNEISYTQSYFANYKQHSLMDGGAIYVFTKNDNVVIRYNYIHDFIGMKDNRGIFCDDGTCNVKIYGNIITNTPNCYSIDLREVARVEKDPQYDFGKVNVGNELYGNIVDGRVRFEGRGNDSENGCFKGTNYILVSGDSLPEFKISSVHEKGKDLTLRCLSVDNKVTVDGKSFKLFQKHPFYKQLKQWVKKGKGTCQ